MNMNKLIIFGIVMLLAVGIVSAYSIATSADGAEEPETSSYTPVECIDGNCNGQCTNPGCGAKVGRSCGCSGN